MHDKRNDSTGPEMDDLETYTRYAAECKRLAQTMSPSDRKTMLEIAEAWLECAKTADAKRSGGRIALDEKKSRD